MSYSIKQVSERTGLSAYTLRYYDREGLLPPIARSSGNMRRFTDADLEWLGLMNCLKRSGMSLQQIKAYMLLCQKGPCTEPQRLALLQDHREHILEQMNALEGFLQMVDHKIAYYDRCGLAVAKGGKAAEGD